MMIEQETNATISDDVFRMALDKAMKRQNILKKERDKRICEYLINTSLSGRDMLIDIVEKEAVIVVLETVWLVLTVYVPVSPVPDNKLVMVVPAVIPVPVITCPTYKEAPGEILVTVNVVPDIDPVTVDVGKLKEKVLVEIAVIV